MEIKDLKIGMTVRTNVNYSGVPAGTIGTVIEYPNSWPDAESVAVKWNRYPGDFLTDWFAFDELHTLDVWSKSL